jgi:MSHA biogenesis protein MshO
MMNNIAIIRPTQGFTLIEAIFVLVITSILATIAFAFIRVPIQAYFDGARRAELTDIADTAIRRIARDVRLALPNSIRTTTVGTTLFCLEFLQTSSGGRYRADLSSNPLAPGDPLDFSISDTSFDVLGPAVTAVINNDLVAVYNLGIPEANAYAGNNTSTITGMTGNKITINTKQFPFASPGNRFQIISSPVSYVCDKTTGLLKRYSNYAIQPVQPVTFTGTSALLAKNVGDCNFTYTSQAITQRTGLLAISLQLTLAGENVSLYHEVHVSNAP